MKKKRLLAMGLALTLALSACGGGDTQESKTPTEGGEGEVAYATDFYDWQTQANESSTFLINYSEERSNTKVLCNCISPLVEYDNHGNLVPAMAESWEPNDDATQWTFHIRKGIYWVDAQGNKKDECTAYDWLTAIEWELNFHKNAAKNTTMLFATIKGAEDYYAAVKEMDEAAGKAIKYTDEIFTTTVGASAPDAYTLVLDMKQPVPYFPTICTGACMFPIAQGQIDELGVDGTFAQQPADMWYNGPYRITEYVNNNSKTMTRNEEYWDKDCQLFEHVYISMVQDAITDDQMFMSGELDRCELSEANLRTIWDDPNNEWRDYLVQPRAVTSNRCLMFSYGKKMEDGSMDVNWNTAAANENFRQAFYYGMDILGYCSYYNYVDPKSTITNTFTCNNVSVFSDGTDYADRVIELLGDPGYRYGSEANRAKAAECVAKAKEELSKQGVTFPVTAWYWIKSGDQAALDLGTIVKDAIEGIADDFVKVELHEYVSNMTQEVTNNSLNSLFIAGWAADYGDPENYNTQLIRGDQSAFFANRAMKVNDMPDSEAKDLLDEYTAMVKAANAITDDMDKRYEAQAQAEAYYFQHALMIPLSSSGTFQLTRANAFTVDFAGYGCMMDVYKNMYATTEKAYSTAQYEQFAADYAAGKI